MNLPDWLTKDYIENALRAFHQNQLLNLETLHIQPALRKGENFGGILNRLKVTYTLPSANANSNGIALQEVQKSLILKTSFEDDEYAKAKMQPYDIFNREMTIYEDVLPQLNALLLEINDCDYNKLFATAICVDRVKQAIIFEDLTAHNYIMADRIRGLDMAHMKLILQKLAKMHATSAAYNERNAKCLEAFDRGFFNLYTNNYSSYFVGCLLTCGRIVSQWPDYSHYGKKLLALAPYYMDIGRKCFQPSDDHINVLNHGDVWTNNVMFKYDIETKKPIDVILIDFQYSFWGSATIDLHHLFCTTLQDSIRHIKQDELFQYYHTIFSDTLRKLNYKYLPLPSLKLFRIEAEQKRFFAVHSTCVIQPVMINEDSTDADFNALMGEDERAMRYKRRIYDNPRVEKNLKIMLPIFDQRGLLEMNQASAQL